MQFLGVPQTEAVAGGKWQLADAQEIDVLSSRLD